MIRIIVKITIAILLLISSFIVKAQEFQGKAVYQTKIKMGDDFKKRMDSSKMSDDRKAFMMEMIKKRVLIAQQMIYYLKILKTKPL